MVRTPETRDNNTRVPILLNGNSLPNQVFRTLLKFCYVHTYKYLSALKIKPGFNND